MNRTYESPAMEVGEIKLQGSLLAGSGTYNYDGTSIDDATLSGFDTLE